MKYLLTILGLSLCLAATLSAQNTPGSEQPAKKIVVHDKNGTHVQSTYPSDKVRCVYYITSTNVTGSHIPAYYCRYQGRNYPIGQSSPGRGFGIDDIGATGALNVGGALRSLDPSFAGH